MSPRFKALPKFGIKNRKREKTLDTLFLKMGLRAEKILGVAELMIIYLESRFAVILVVQEGLHQEYLQPMQPIF